MGRPRAGYGWTCFRRGKRTIALIWSEGRWVTTGEAARWPRCIRCRRPVENLVPGEHCGGCWYRLATPEQRREHFAQRYGVSLQNSLIDSFVRWDRTPLSDPAVNWRHYLKESQMVIPDNQRSPVQRPSGWKGTA